MRNRGAKTGGLQPVIWAAVLTFALDQISKYLVVQKMGLAEAGAIDVLPPWLQFRMAWNQGVNFGLFANSAEAARFVLIGVSLAIAIWIWAWIARSHQPASARIAAGLLIGGALGNVIDRVLYGAVADFLNMGFPGFRNPYSFNVADIAIFLGALGLVLFARGKEKNA